jgi:hypothetical protein
MVFIPFAFSFLNLLGAEVIMSFAVNCILYEFVIIKKPPPKGAVQINDFLFKNRLLMYFSCKLQRLASLILSSPQIS